MLNIFELSQLTATPLKAKEKRKLVGACKKRRESTWNRFVDQREEIIEELRRSSIWKVAIKFGFCHKTLGKYLQEFQQENN